jgi:ring-1,2-phenylacetyl-CoA epoxidase subunit PaaD
MISKPYNKKVIWDLVREIPDPEIPVITIQELGVLRDVEFDEAGNPVVVITPTYTGCPAMKMFEDDIVATLIAAGVKGASIKTIYQPAWTTDWITDAAKEKLRAYGIAPPEGTADKKALLGDPKQVQCPQCGSRNTTLISQFGSTACKALWKCGDCLEPFDYFKCI